MNQSLIHNFKIWISETEPETLKWQLTPLLIKSDYEILNFVEYYFKPFGYTCLWLLVDSHLAVHTFPEYNCTYIELSGCSYQKSKNFISFFNVEFEGKFTENRHLQQSL